MYHNNAQPNGDKMKVTVRNPQYSIKDRYFFEVPEFIIYEGDEVKCGKWEDPAEVLCLTTDIDFFPVRSIQRKHIYSIDGTTVLHTAVKKDVVTKVVKGSKGQEYVVTLGSKKTCTCPGFTFRHTCKHILETA